MADIAVPVSKFTDGTLPEVCARTGNLARNRYRLVAKGPSGAVPGIVPLSRDAVRALQLVRVSALGFLGFALLCALGFIATQSAGFAIVGVGLALGAVVIAVSAARRAVSARVTGDSVTLRNVHPNFVSAVAVPPSKCAGCTSSGSCSVAEMDACEGEPAHAHAH